MYNAAMARARNYLAGFGASAIFGFSFLFTKNALDSLRSHELLFFRFLTAALLMSVLAVLGVVRLDFKGKKLGPLVLTAILQPVLYFILETEGLRHVESSTAGIILSSIPIAVAALAAVLLKERLRPVQVLSSLLSFGGVLLVVVFRARGNVGGSPLGIMLIVGAVLCAAGFNIASRSGSRRFSAAETTFFMMWAGALFFGGLYAVRSIGADGPSLASRLGPSALAGIAYLGILSSVVAFFLVNYNLSKLKSPEAAVFANLTTLVSVVAGVMFRNESLLWTDALGGVMILAGVWATNTLGRNPKPEPSSA